MAQNTMIKQWMGKDAEKAFVNGDGSPADRLNSLYNAIKHFHGRIVDGQPAAFPPPLWIVNDGLKCHEPGKSAVVLSFVDMAVLLGELTKNAHFISEEVYRLARERQSSSDTSPQP